MALLCICWVIYNPKVAIMELFAKIANPARQVRAVVVVVFFGSLWPCKKTYDASTILYINGFIPKKQHQHSGWSRFIFPVAIFSKMTNLS